MSFTYNNYHSEDVEIFRQRVIRRQIGWCYALGLHLRKQNALRGLEKYIDRDELEALADIENIPAALLDNMGSDLHLALDKGWINSYQQVELDRTLSKLTDSMGKCERIKNTVFPTPIACTYIYR